MIERSQELLHSFEKLEFPKLISYLKSICQTELGQQYFEELPIYSDRISLEKEFRIVDQSHSLCSGNVFPDLTGAKDVRNSLARASKEGSFLAGKEFRDLSVFLHAVDRARKGILKHKGDYQELSEIGFRLYPDTLLEFNINKAVDDDGNVRDDASKDLHRVRMSLNRIRGTLRKKIISIARTLSEQDYSEDDIFTQRDGRLVLPVKSEFKRQIPGLIHGSSATGQTVFIEPSEAVELNNEVISLQFEEQREVEKILRELTDTVREVVPKLYQDVEVMAYLDSLYARATYAVRLSAIVPPAGMTPVPRLVKARHPLLAIKLGRVKVTPVDMFLDDATRVVVVSGPNSGGKTVTLKTVGLLVLCNLTAIPLTADPGTELPLYDRIFVDIGDEQSIENNLSSFTSRMKHFVDVLASADEKSLVLVDEFGEETEPAEGAALASAILEDLRNAGAMCLVTTHNSGLKVFASDAPGMLNAAMEFDQKTLAPTYKLILGRPGSSYAFEIAQRTGINSSIVDRARKYVGEGREKLESLLLRVERLENELRERVLEIKREQELAETMRQEYEKKVYSAKKEASQIKTKAIEESESIVRDLNSKIENLVREIRESGADKAAIRRAHEVVEDLKSRVVTARNESESSKKTFKVGDPVMLKGTLLDGYIVEKSNEKGELLVEINGLKMRVHESELTPTTKSGARSAGPGIQIQSGIQTKLDIRGMRSFEIQSTTEKFLDEAYLGGLSQVEIIHGTGTGSLRRAVEQLLKVHPFVKSFRSGEYAEGGQGVTFVQLKAD